MSVLVIAEAGVNHNGRLDLACELVDVAAAAGADVVKFQTFRADRLVTHNAQKAAYQRVRTGDRESQYEMLQSLELTEGMHEALSSRCAERGIEFLSTPFDLESASMLVTLGVRRLKIPSGEITNLPFLRGIAALGRPVLLSTGMSTLEEVSAAIDELSRAGLLRTDLTLLQCCTAYPAPFEEVNLRAMQTMRDAFDVHVGLSDHTLGWAVAMGAVACGATVIEKHFTLDRTLPGPDHAASLEPNDLRELVTGIRNVEAALGVPVKRVMPSEEANRLVARRSIVAACDIAVGAVMRESDLTAKRPGTGVSPMDWDKYVGRVATRDYRADDLIEP